MSAISRLTGFILLLYDRRTRTSHWHLLTQTLLPKLDTPQKSLSLELSQPERSDRRFLCLQSFPSTAAQTIPLQRILRRVATEIHVAKDPITRLVAAGPNVRTDASLAIRQLTKIVFGQSTMHSTLLLILCRLLVFAFLSA